MSPINSSKKHGIQTFSFRRPRNSDSIFRVVEDEKTGEKTFETVGVTLPVLILHRNHSPAPVVSSIELPALRRFYAAFHHPRRNNGILIRHLTRNHIVPSNSEMQHDARMRRDQCYAVCRRKGIYRPTMSQLDTAAQLITWLEKGE